MKKTVTILTTILLSFIMIQSDVYAAPLETIEAYVSGGEDDELVATGIFETHDMAVTVGGTTYHAYCSWYEKDAPLGVRIATKTFRKMQIDDSLAAGLSAIMNNTAVKSEYSGKSGYNGVTDEELVAIRTAAINLLLSEKTGYNRFDGMDFKNGIFSVDTSINGLLKNFKSQYDIFDSNWNNCNTDYNGGKYGKTTTKAKYYSCQNQAATYYLYLKGIEASSTVTNAYLKFDSATSKELEYKDGYYTGNFIVKSNVTLDSEKPLQYKITGVTDQSKVIVEKNISGATGTLKVKIPEDIVKTDASEIKVEVSATITNKKSVIYELEDAGLKNVYQDLLFALYEEEPITISTDAKATPVARRCYKYTTSCESTACDNTNRNNERSCYSKIEMYYAASCGENDTLNKESGQKTIELDSTCSLYCTETAKASYPGNVGSAITIGTNLTWPTGASGTYPLTTKSTLTCKIEMTNGGSVTQSCIDKAKNAKYKNASGGEVVYDDTVDDVTISLKQTCSSSTSVSGSTVIIKNQCSYSLPTNKNMAINKKTLEYADNVSNTQSTGFTDFLLVKYYNGLLPVGGISWSIGAMNDEIFTKSYELSIRNLPLGYNGQFKEQLNKTSYICNYKITKAVSGSCDCPPGTTNYGESLYELMKTKPMTCAEAKAVYCNSDTVKICYTPTGEKKDITKCLADNNNDEEKCKEIYECTVYCDKPNGTKVNITECLKTNSEDYCETANGCTMRHYCTKANGDEVDITDCLNTNNNNINYCEIQNDCTTDSTSCPPDSLHPEKSYAFCMDTGKSQEDCIQEVCYDVCTINCTYSCPANTIYAGKNITTCVNTERKNGKNLTAALNECYKQCDSSSDTDDDDDGLIIYRTISLENPFPGKGAYNDSTELKALNYGSLNTANKTFNQDIKGRYPGTNWNSVTLVYDKILNNRGYTGSKIYQEAEPLYVIELDPTSIKKIREYNKNQQKNEIGGYADFTLNCTDGAYCISTFLRKAEITTATGAKILTGGTCMNATNKSGFISCYTTKNGS